MDCGDGQVKDSQPLDLQWRKPDQRHSQKFVLGYKFLLHNQGEHGSEPLRK